MKNLANDAVVKEAKKRFLGLTASQLVLLAVALVAAYLLLGPIFAFIKTLVILAAVAVLGYGAFKFLGSKG